MDRSEHQEIRDLFDDYLRMYSTRDDRLTTYFSDDFSGFTGGGDFLVKDRGEWVAITRQDFAQIKDPLHLELLDVAIQSLAETVAVATGFFTIQLPIVERLLSRTTARLVLIFRREPAGWKICHSSISLPNGLVRDGEVYPLKELTDRNQFLEDLVAERTLQLSEANDELRRTNEQLARTSAEHAQAEASLRENKRQYDNLVSRIPVGICIMRNTPAGGLALDYVSPRFAAMFNASPESMLAEPRVAFRSMHPDDLASFLGAIQAGVQDRRPIAWTGRVPADGTARWLDVVCSPEPLESGDVLWHGLVVDITERKQAEVDREGLEAQSRQLQKAESLGRMAGAVAHHFNNQLQAVTMGVELALNDLPRDAGPVGILTDALRSARKAAEVSGSLLTYLGQALGKRETLDLADACRRSLSLMRAVIPEGVAFATDLPSPGPAIRANKGEIQHILNHLATNAWEAMGDRRGAIRLSVSTVAGAAITTTNRFPVDFHLQDTAYACLELADAGCGIAAADVEKLFDPFYSSKLTGRGLGLPVVLGIVRAYDGAITVESEPGRGSAFRVFLPVSAEAAAVRPMRASATAGTAAGCTVLVVDDEPAVRRGATRALTKAGYTVLAAEDGIEALEVFREHQGEIGCVLCDVTMPRMNGWQTLAALRELAPGRPVILASGYSESQVMDGHHPQLPQAFLSKPYSFEALVTALRQVMGNPAARLPGDPDGRLPGLVEAPPSSEDARALTQEE